MVRARARASCASAALACCRLVWGCVIGDVRWRLLTYLLLLHTVTGTKAQRDTSVYTHS